MNMTSPNTGYTAHFVRPNWLSPTSYSPRTLSAIVLYDHKIVIDEEEHEEY